ncbi:hypothetical protein KC19_2G129700 [Ceratodon purpureus]|uniref:Uncharacterized protein n=1 Tax=Ceratodon purpureus TaxID=3225 RepID=A0A8T0IUZ8_CERPU|nr:hypothetical protein KC19_2G129700 [Ceratodon purpureus]
MMTRSSGLTYCRTPLCKWSSPLRSTLISLGKNPRLKLCEPPSCSSSSVVFLVSFLLDFLLRWSLRRGILFCRLFLCAVAELATPRATVDDSMCHFGIWPASFALAARDKNGVSHTHHITPSGSA